jgi:hypothetical protein
MGPVSGVGREKGEGMGGEHDGSTSHIFMYVKILKETHHILFENEKDEGVKGAQQRGASMEIPH